MERVYRVTTTEVHEMDLPQGYVGTYRANSTNATWGAGADTLTNVPERWPY